MKSNTLISQEAFNKAVATRLKEIYGDTFNIEVTQVHKNNDIILHGLSIGDKKQEPWKKRKFQDSCLQMEYKNMEKWFELC